MSSGLGIGLPDMGLRFEIAILILLTRLARVLIECSVFSPSLTPELHASGLQGLGRKPRLQTPKLKSKTAWLPAGASPDMAAQSPCFSFGIPLISLCAFASVAIPAFTPPPPDIRLAYHIKFKRAP